MVRNYTNFHHHSQVVRHRFEAIKGGFYFWCIAQFSGARGLPKMPREHEGGGHRRNHGLGQQLRSTNACLVDEWSGRCGENCDRTYNRGNVLRSRNTRRQFLLFSQRVRQEREKVSHHDDRQPTHCSNTANAGTCWNCIARGPFPPLSFPRNPTGGFSREAARASQFTGRHQRH